MSSFPAILRDLRTARGFSQAGLAKAVRPGLTGGAVGQWERGAAGPGVEDLKRLADVLNVSVDELVGHVPLGQRTRFSVDADLDQLTTTLRCTASSIEDALSKLDAIRGSPKAKPRPKRKAKK